MHTNNINQFITKEKIPYGRKLKYLITIPCVNREERNAINVIDKTFDSFEKSGMFNSDISFTILLFESGSVNKDYLNCLEKYKEHVQIIYSNIPLNGNSNTLRMFVYLSKLPKKSYDFVLWMDDDVFVCNNFIKNADIWIKNYANLSIFSSLYVPYESFFIQNRKYVQLANLPGFYGTCCTIFKPSLSQYIVPNWYDAHFEQFAYNPDTRFRDSVRKYFPNANKICVSFPSLVEHMNIGSAIKQKKEVKTGHKSKYFIGEDKDPELYIKDIF